MIDLFYDDECPICRRMAFYAKSKAYDNLSIHALNDFTAAIWELNYSDISSVPHGIVDGKLRSGINLVSPVLRSMGYKRIAWFIKLPVINRVASGLWNLFIKYKHLLPV